LSLQLRNLSSKNSIFEITNEFEDKVTIEGFARLECLLNFPVELNKITSGLGHLNTG